jgi:hypothetical protein
MHKLTNIALKLGKNIFLAGLVTLAATALIPKASQAQSNRFFCQTAIVRGKKVPVTYATTKGQGNVPMIAWVRNDFANSISPRKRCQAVARRFQAHYENRTLKYARTGQVDGYPVICIANYKGGACPRNQVLVTLKRGSDASQVLSQLLDFRGLSNGRLVYLNGEQIFSYEDGETYADMALFLESSADSQLQSAP